MGIGENIRKRNQLLKSDIKINGSLTEYHPALTAMGVDMEKFSSLWENLESIPGMYDVDIGYLEMQQKKIGNLGILCLGQDCNPKHVEKILEKFPGLTILESKTQETKMKLGKFSFVQKADISCRIGKNTVRINLVEKR